MYKLTKKTGYAYALLASMPLLILGGCASTDSNKMNQHASSDVVETVPVSESQPVVAEAEVPAAEATMPEAESIASTDEIAPASSDAERYPISLSIEPEEKLIGFGFDKFEVDAQYQELLKQHASFLTDNPDLTLQVNGHTDSSGDKTYNRYLSKKRADEVARLLVEYGAPQERISISGNADDEPLISATHHREHRRVELNYQDQRLVSK